MDSIKKGNITELEVQLFLVKEGYHVFTPVTDGSSVDLIFIDNAHQAKKIQIKKARKTSTGFKIDLRKSTSSSRIRKKAYQPFEIDYYATTFLGKCYLLPVAEFCNMSQIVLRFDDSYKNQNKPYYAEDYEL